MSETQLDAFLRGNPPKDEERPAPDAPEQADATPAEKQAETPADPPEEAEATPEAEAEPNNFRKLRSVVDATKKEREDWKTKATIAETRLEALQREMEEAKRAASRPQQPPAQPQAPPNPATDPAGYHEQVQRQLVNERLNMSEMMARRELGSEKVDALVAEFRAEAAQDGSLFDKLCLQPDPYQWAAKEMERRRLVREVGDDPAGYEAKLRAKWEAERGQPEAPPRVSPAAGMQPSLAGQRSVAARTAPGFSGPPAMEDIFPKR